MRLTLGALLILCLHGPVAAQTFHGRTIQIPGGSNVLVTGINDSGAMVANYNDTAGTAHCVFIAGTAMTQIVDPNEVGTGPGKGTSCWGINNSNQIAGSYSAATFGNGFAFTGTQYVDIIFPGATAGTTAYGLNNVGAIVGSYADNVGQHGFVYVVPQGRYVTLDVPGATVTLAIAINDAGLATFEWLNSSFVYSGAIYSGGHFRILNVPGALQSKARGVNVHGWIDFTAQDASGVWHGYLYKPGTNTFTRFDMPGAANTYGFGINSAGQLVGGYNPGLNPTAELGFTGNIH